MSKLQHRPRVRRMVERAARGGLRAVGAPEFLEHVAEPTELPPPVPSPPSAEDFVRGILPQAFAGRAQNRASALLYERLGADDIIEVERLIAEWPELQAQYAAASHPATRHHMVLAFGIWLNADVITRRSGLPDAQPEEHVHVMARGATAAAGGLYEADMVVDALASAGIDIAGADTALDFGCSSGRVVRVLAAAYPDIHWHGCDPNAPAIEWASENLSGIDFFVSEDAPPLPLSDGSLDLAYAISIWSHFAPELGLHWFEEMHRVLRPGGHLVCTTHGLTSIAYYATLDLRTPEQSLEIRDALYRDGSWYAPEFGEEGDWGVVNPDWGTAFLSPEWMLAKLCPAWRILEFAPGRNQENQDVYVLQRV
ncbi:MAG TPA: class I SAM-dependent methyltransferase [Solirubrobacteraceae bacterium]|jgi:SAM-dependent methyltransferase|nr:class I SAM-dependent methyltransferase [Solirubrobacteraceae bacterium]